MTTKLTLNVDEKEIEKIVESMPLGFKLRLVRKLEEETRQKRWGELFKRINGRFQKYPITEKEIAQEIAAVRKAKYAQGRS
ncbi:MAG: hypothetical protein KKC11_05335 [Candidatus Omnitrophica bacterium]|nr:hypothetical protein [Candidatus Omnitrophota bacterium]